MSMHVELAFFDGDTLLCHGAITCGAFERSDLFSGSDHDFRVTHQLEEPTCPITMSCTRAGLPLYRGALGMGVHTSQDWESINLGNIHTLAFCCRVDSEDAVYKALQLTRGRLGLRGILAGGRSDWRWIRRPPAGCGILSPRRRAAERPIR